MAQKFCAVCGEENEEHFTYCKHCGAFLPVVEKFEEEPLVKEDKPDFDGISYQEYQHYVGSGSENILYDFERLDKGQSFVFSLPALFLGLFFGFYGLSAWFFYRNLKKIGIILLALGAFFTLADSIVNYSVSRMLITEIYSILNSRSFNVTAVMQQLINSVYYYGSSFITVFKPIGFFASFFVSAFCLKIYKKDSAKNIMRAKEMCSVEGAPPLDFVLRKAGGTNAALAVLPFMFYFALPIICLAVGFI